MTYEDTIAYMYQQLPMFHRIGKSAYKANLDTAMYFDRYFSFPHKSYKTIHVAGTNGKGSVSHTLATILQASGYKTGLFTSPHLVDFRERIRVNGVMIPREEVTAFVETHRTAFEEIHPSFFEMTSALAFYYFQKAEVDVAVIEVGMGGRLDSTNIIDPVLSVITNIGFDHTEFLGDTLSKIAVEKAGIIKPSGPVVIGQYHEETWPVFKAFADRNNCDIFLADETYQTREAELLANDHRMFQVYRQQILAYPDLELDLAGLYQQKNICTVLMAVEVLNNSGFYLPKQSIYDACRQVARISGLQGRWQVLGHHPLVVCDTGHNKDGISWILEQFQTLSFQQLHMVIGFVNDKDISGILKMLPADATYYYTNASIPRALEAGELGKMAGKTGLNGRAYSNVKEALAAASSCAKPDDFIFIGGSTFIVAEVLD